MYSTENYAFPFEIKEHGVQIGKHNRKSSNLDTNLNQMCSKEGSTSGAGSIQCHPLPTEWLGKKIRVFGNEACMHRKCTPSVPTHLSGAYYSWKQSLFPSSNV